MGHAGFKVPIDDDQSSQIEGGMRAHQHKQPAREGDYTHNKTSILHVFVLQLVDSHCQLSESARLDGIFPILKLYYRAFGNSGLPREKVGGKLFGKKGSA